MTKYRIAYFLAFALMAGISLCHAYTTENATFLEFSDSGVTVTEGPYTGYSVKATTVTLGSAGTYVFSGTCSNGSIKVKKATTGTVRVVLAGVTLTAGGSETTDDEGLVVHTATAPLLVNKDNTVIIEAYAGTVNTLTDSPYNNDDSAPSASTDTENAVLKVKAGSTATLCGTGTLKIVSYGKNGIKAGSETDSPSLLKIKELTLDVTAKVNDGISVENAVKFYSGDISVNAVGDAIQAEPDEEDASGAGDVVIYGGTLKLTADGEGIQASNELYVSGGSITATAGEDGLKGEKNVFIDGGAINVTSTLDGIQSDEGGVYITDGTVNIKAGGGASTRLTGDSDSCKGIKAETTLFVTAGDFVVNSADDCLHSDDTIAITGGMFTLATSTSGKDSTYSGGDAIHADYTLVVGTDDGGVTTPSITITSCYEGLEAAKIYVLSGYVDVTSSDDGFNAANKNIASESTTAFSLNIYGGEIHIKAAGDGLDSNGNMKIYGGTTEVNCTANGGNNALDTADRGYLSVSGSGSLVTLGPSDMAVTPNANYSTVPYVTFGSASQGGPGGGPGGFGGSSSSTSISIPSGTTWYIRNSSGTTLATGTTASTVSYVVFASSTLTANQTYYLVYGSTQKSATATASKASSVTQENVPSVAQDVSAYVGTGAEEYLLTVNGVTTEKAQGQTISVTAEEKEGSTFLSWSAVGIELDDPAARTQTFNMPANDVTLTANYDDDSNPILLFSNTSITRVSGTARGYTLDGTTLSITSANTYMLSGTCSDGAISIKKGLADVTIVLNGLTLENTTTAPIVCGKGSSVVIELADGSENTLSDNAYNNDDIHADNANAENAVIKGKKGGTSVTIGGSGSLTVNANGKNGIKVAAEGTLTLQDSISLTVNASVNDAISSDNLLVITGGTYIISAAGDGLVASPDEDDASSQGSVSIGGGTITITAGNDAIQARTLNVSGGQITATGVASSLDITSGNITDGALELYATDADGSALLYTDTLNMSGGSLIAGDSNSASQSLSVGDGLYSALVAYTSIDANEPYVICLSDGSSMQITAAQSITHLIIANADIQGATASTAFFATIVPGWNLVVIPAEYSEDEISELNAFSFDPSSRCYVRGAKAGQPAWLFAATGGAKLSGYPAENCWILPKENGWHLVGAPFDIPVAFLGETCAWSFENGSFQKVTDSLVGGKAYWLYVE
ncbi:MAG: carbohydrate-binding domain-containing protein [Victivallales bacterium]|nr:carbohydrate-binding domain-containing protein [Victivallales bacterium]